MLVIDQHSSAYTKEGRSTDLEYITYDGDIVLVDSIEVLTSSKLDMHNTNNNLFSLVGRTSSNKLVVIVKDSPYKYILDKISDICSSSTRKEV